MVETTFEEAIKDLTYELIAQNHLGWENNDGAYGELVIDTATGKAGLEHSTRFVRAETDAHEWEC